MRIKLIVAYDGTGLNGFQRQNNLPTVQEKLENALKSLYGDEITVVGSGRTDAGVHALGQVVHYDCEKELLLSRIVAGLNYYLRETNIRVISAEKAEPNFDARKSAHKKTYFYDMYFGDTENPVLKDRAYFAGKKPDIEKMQAAAKTFEGTHDFKAFRCEGSSAKTTVRTVYECCAEEIELYGSPALRITISADGFLYKMVRIICGYIFRYGEAVFQTSDTDINNASPNKKIPLPPQGLYLKSVEY